MSTNALPQEEFDPDECPELDEEWFKGATLMQGRKVLRLGRPPIPKFAQRMQVTMRLPPNVLAHFRATGPGWQRRIADVLEAHIASAK